MITILHGENTTASRKELDLIRSKEKTKELVLLNGNKIDKTNLIEALESKSLFKVDRLIIIESFFSSKKKLDFANILEQNQTEEIVIWEPKEITKTNLAKLPKNSNIKLFKFEKVLFKFMESLKPGNQKYLLTLFNLCLKTEEVELIFFMIIRQFRNLLIAKDFGNKQNPEINSWQLSRLTNQSKYFTMGELLMNYQKLLEIDISQKTGNTAFDLKKNLELFIINL